MEKSRGNWRTILLAVGGAGGGLLAIGFATLLAVYAGFASLPGSFHNDPLTNLQAEVTASALILAGAILLIAGYYSIQRLRGREIPPANVQPLKLWQGIVLFIVWVGSAGLAEVLFKDDLLRWFTPPLYLVAIGTPVYFLARLAAGGLLHGTRQRMWGVFSTSMALGTSLAILAEGSLAILGLIGVGVYFGVHPGQMTQLRDFLNHLSTAPDVEQFLTTFSDWLTNPLTILVALLFFSGFTPFIEETAKSIAPWILFDRLDSPAQGFAIGALSGAGFGLLESLLASSAPDSSWATTLLVRGGSTMMHVMAAGITGWSIAAFRARRQARYLVGGYALAMFLHSLWNACVVMIVIGGVLTAAQVNAPDILGVLLIGFGIAVLGALLLSIPILLGMTNWRLRSRANSPDAPSSPVQAEPREESGGVE